MLPLLFSDLPKDIILEVVNFLALPDHISLLLTCSSVYILSNQRSFWISALNTTRLKSTIACPPSTDMSQYTLDSLRGMAFSWLKLQDNWNRPFPKIKQPTTSTFLSEPADIICAVQGTDILLLHMRESGTIICWDTKNATPFPFPCIETGGRVNGVSPTYDSYGQCSIALLTLQETYPFTARRHVVTIKHEDRKAVSFGSVFSDVSTPSGSYFESLFVTEDMAGSVVVEELQEHCEIIARNIGTESFKDSVSLMKLCRPVSSPRDLTVCFSYKGHLYNLLEDGISVQIQHISRENLRSRRLEEWGLYKSDILAPRTPCIPFCFILPSTPFYGVSAVFQHVAGRLLNMALLWMDHSGFTVVVVVESNEGDAALMLVRYHSETASTSSHTLAVPDSIDLNTLNSVCVDDTAGAVHLVDALGVFSTLRYV
ncbi:hypothetical protein C8R44DRAFT_782839 [Mycena epipterygia]|nr:hypothetical protein C8R44DRAFT_782839 [Mycena epipterygia]